MAKTLGECDLLLITGYFIRWGFTTISGHTDSRYPLLYHPFGSGVCEGNISLKPRYLLSWGFPETCGNINSKWPNYACIILLEWGSGRGIYHSDHGMCLDGASLKLVETSVAKAPSLPVSSFGEGGVGGGYITKSTRYLL